MEIKTEDNDKAILEEMIARASRAPEPGDIKVGDVVKNDDAPMIISSLSSAGWSYMWDNRTGERSLTNNNMLVSQLKKTRPDGSRVFTLQKPDITPKTGVIKCHLHSENPMRAYYDEMGFPVCRKSNLISPYQQERHMQHRHPDEWRAIEKDRLEKEKAEGREFRRSLISNTGKAPAMTVEPDEAPLYVSDKPKITKTHGKRR